MFLLRAVVGIISVIQGGVFLTDGGVAFESWAVGLTMVASGAAMLIGFLTPIASVLVALATIGIGASWVPPPTRNLFHTPLPTILVMTVAVALIMLGPGAVSVDRRLFGRREIIIPHTPKPPAS